MCYISESTSQGKGKNCFSETTITNIPQLRDQPVLHGRKLQVGGAHTTKTSLYTILPALRHIEIHTGKIHMYFVTLVLYEITCIPSNTDKPDTNSNVGLCVLI